MSVRNSTDTGQRAEQAATEYLVQRGYVIIDRNWRTPRCEIDIIASKDQLLSFIEVKYRQHEYQGTGLEYITPAKLRQMRFAANIWCRLHDWRSNYNLAAIEVSGSNWAIGDFISSIDID